MLVEGGGFLLVMGRKIINKETKRNINIVELYIEMCDIKLTMTKLEIYLPGYKYTKQGSKNFKL